MSRAKNGVNGTAAGKAKRIASLRASKAVNTSTMPSAALANPNRPLTEKMRAFVKFWAQGETVLMASFKAGYSDNGTYAYRLAKDPAILKIYNEEKRLYAESCQMTRKKVMDGLLDGIGMAKMVADPASVIRGWREVGLMCGFYEPVKRQIDINVKGDITMKHLEQLSDTELLRIIKGEAEDAVFRELEAPVEDEDG